MGLWHREPGTARAAGVAGARPPAAPPLPVSLLVDALDALAVVVPPPPAAARDDPPDRSR